MKEYKDYPSNIKSRIDKLGGIEAWKAEQKAKRGLVKNEGAYLKGLKKNDPEKFKEISARGGANKARNAKK